MGCLPGASAAFGLVAIDLVRTMSDHWTGEQPYPGDPYDHDGFRAVYTDHHPVVFKLSIPAGDDD